MANEGVLQIKILGDDRQFKKTVKGLEDTLAGIATGGAALLAGAGLAAGAAFAGAFSEAVDRERMNDKLAAQLRLTDGAAAQAGQVAAEVYAGAWGDSIGDVNEAIRSIGTNLADLNDVGADELESLTTQALDLATAFDKDVNEVVAGAGQLLRNDLADSADEAFDLITRGFEDGGDRAQDLLETLNEYAEPLKSLGLDGADSIGLLVEGLEQGAFNADKVGDAIKEFSVRAIDGSKATGEAFETIGLNADRMAQRLANGGEDARLAMSEIIRALADVEDKVAQDAAGVALFGSMWEDLGPQVILALDPVVQRIDDVSGATERMGDTLNDNLGTKWESLWRSAKEVVVQFASPVVTWLGEVFDLFEEKMEDLEPQLTDAEQATATFEDALAQRFGENIPEHFETFQNGLRTSRESAEEEMDAIGRTMEALSDTWDEVFENDIKPWFEDTFVPWLQNEVGPMLWDAGKAIGRSLGRAILEGMKSWLRLEWEEEVQDILESTGNDADTREQTDRWLEDNWSEPGSSSPSGSIGGSGSAMPMLHDGGVVPGLPGQEVPILAMAGETVLPTHKTGAGASYAVNFNGPYYAVAPDDPWHELRKLAMAVA